MLECALFIDGERRAPIGGEWYDVNDPADGTLVGRTAMATAADVDVAVSSAEKAALAWANTHADERARILHRAADLIEERIDDIATVLTRE